MYVKSPTYKQAHPRKDTPRALEASEGRPAVNVVAMRAHDGRIKTHLT